MQSIWTLLSWGPEGWIDDIAYGVFITISLAACTLPVGLLIGFFVALAKRSEEKSLRLAGNIYTTIFRGLPELLTLFLVYYGVQIGLQNIVMRGQGLESAWLPVGVLMAYAAGFFGLAVWRFPKAAA